MFPSRSTLLLLAAITGSARAAIDFTPSINEYTGEGIVYRKVTFKNDEGSIVYLPPNGWHIRGGKDQAQLTPPRTKFGEAIIQARPLPSPQPFDDATAQALERQVLQQAPPNSQGVEILKREQNPVLMNQYLSFEVVIAYQTLGYAFQRSVLFIHSPNAELIFQFSAPKAEFAAFNDAFHRSIGTWQWVEARPAQNPAVPAPAATTQPPAGQTN